jgi:hypothetical protein
VAPADDYGVEFVLADHGTGSAQITFDFALGTHARLVGILTRFAQRPALPQQIPTLVELHLEATEPAMLLGFVDLAVLKLRPQFLLLGNQLIDSSENVSVFIRVCGHPSSLPDYRVNRGH